MGQVGLPRLRRRLGPTEAVLFFVTSKEVANGAQDAIQQHDTAQKQKEKEKNRVIGRSLKDRSANTRGKRKAVGAVSGKQVKEVEAILLDDEESGLDDARRAVRAGRSWRSGWHARWRKHKCEDDDEELVGLGDDVGMDEEAYSPRSRSLKHRHFPASCDTRL